MEASRHRQSPDPEAQSQSTAVGDDDEHHDHEAASSTHGADASSSEKGQEKKNSPPAAQPLPIPTPQYVSFDGPNDPANPLNWSYARRGLYTCLLGLLTAGATFGSAIFSQSISTLSQIYGVSSEVMLLGQSLFVLGFAAGPICFGPASEVFGRKPSVLIPYFIYLCFTAAQGASQDLQSIFITRFFAGFFASAPVSNTGGALADMYNQKERGAAVVVYSFAVVGGPMIAPVVGSAIVTSYLSWRWTAWINLILISLIWLLNLFIVPETNKDIILQNKARRLRFETNNWLILAPRDTVKLDLQIFVRKTVTLPLLLLVQEPVLLTIALYNSFVYGLLYSFFEAFPIVFEKHRGWTPVESSLPFLAVLVGVIIAGFINIGYSVLFYVPKFEKNNGQVPPEARLPPMILGSIVFPIGVFWFGNTANAHAANEVVACVFVGCGFLLIFQTGLIYIIDCFAKISASAVAANTILRSAVAAGLPFAIRPMYSNLGIRWATNLIGFISVALAISPPLFYVFGPRLRQASKRMRS